MVLVHRFCLFLLCKKSTLPLMQCDFAIYNRKERGILSVYFTKNHALLLVHVLSQTHPPQGETWRASPGDEGYGSARSLDRMDTLRRWPDRNYCIIGQCRHAAGKSHVQYEAEFYTLTQIDFCRGHPRSTPRASNHC